MGMADDAVAISVVIPVATAGASTKDCLRQVLRSLERFGDASELILVLNGLGQADRDGLADVLGHPGVLCIERAERLGSAPARCLGVRQARGRRILFTDADCRVPDDWVAQMAEAGAASDVACGQVQAANTCVNAYVRIEEEIDRLRNSMLTPKGTRRFPVVANMIARPDLAALIVDDRDNTAEDVQLSLEYNLRGVPVAGTDHVVVRTIYPSSLAQCLSRRVKHAKGFAFAQRLWSRTEWRRLGMRGPVALALAAFVRVWRMRVSRFEQMTALALHLWFAAAWACYLVVRPRRIRRGAAVGAAQRSTGA
jgi:glycosyltransferase involved in cell wall biosynthesis